MPSQTSTPPTVSAALASSLSLIIHCSSTLHSPRYTTPTTLLPLDLLHDSATLARAHVTRLSLSLRPPVTADAAVKFITELGSSIVPALVAAVESCNPDEYGITLASEARAAVKGLLSALEEYLAGAERGGDRLLNTGVVWSGADRVIALKKQGLTGVVDRLIKGYGELVKDASEELKQWIEADAVEGDEESNGSDAEPSHGDDTDEQAFWDRPISKTKKDAERLRSSTELSLKKMRLIVILFGAARKRRLGPSAEGGGRLVSDAKRVDKIAFLGKDISELADDLGMAYYEESLEAACDAYEDLMAKTSELAELLTSADNGEKDGYSAWFENCKATLGKPA